MSKRYQVDADITLASTLDSAFYHDEAAHRIARERVFARTWQWLGDLADVATPASLSPRDLLPGMLDQPLLLSRDTVGDLRCLSNVCTHRGNLLVKAPCQASQIRCGYHSRRFDMRGRMTFMPEFGAAKNFPSPADDLPNVPFGPWGNHAFASLDPIASLDEFLAPVKKRMSWLPLDSFAFDATQSRDYVIDANWALYVENYLEGFHIPFVHAGLNQTVDYGSYSTELHRFASLQLAMAKEGESYFYLPPHSPESGQKVAAYYWWIFPNLMLNFYPWGLSLNLVQPEGVGRTRVAFRSYVWKREKMASGAGAALHEVEMEDEAIVLAVQRGTASPLYDCGRYSPTREQGTHHFHRLLCEFLNEPHVCGGSAARSAGQMMDDAET
ncbi:MAG: SRPBCC family protein [Betaproteobacteria bacterium]